MTNLDELQEKINIAVKETIDHYMQHLIMDYPSANPKLTKVVNEGLIMTYGVAKTMQILQRNFDLSSLGCSIGKLFNNADSTDDVMQSQNPSLLTTREMKCDWAINIYFNNGFQNCSYDKLLEIIHLFETCGWYFSNFQDDNVLTKKRLSSQLFNEFQNKRCFLIFRAKYGIIKDNKLIGDTVYHICPTRSLNKILEQGLIPKQKGRTTNHPQRVYLFIGQNTPKVWEEIADRFYESSGIDDYTLLSIKTNKLKQEMTFYYDDVRMTDRDAVYIQEPITPQYIKAIDRYIVKHDIYDKQQIDFKNSVNN